MNESSLKDIYIYFFFFPCDKRMQLEALLAPGTWHLQAVYNEVMQNSKCTSCECLFSVVVFASSGVLFEKSKQI